MANPMLYRRRFIPNETIPLQDDIILHLDDNFIVTKWVTLHPRKDIAWGISAYYLDQGFKVSKIFDKHNNVVYWYCDIIQAKKEPERNAIIIEDLLIDVVLYNDDSMRILDLEELSDALEQQLISQQETTYTLRTLNNLLKLIYSGQFHVLQTPVNQYDAL